MAAAYTRAPRATRARAGVSVGGDGPGAAGPDGRAAGRTADRSIGRAADRSIGRTVGRWSAPLRPVGNAGADGGVDPPPGTRPGALYHREQETAVMLPGLGAKFRAGCASAAPVALLVVATLFVVYALCARRAAGLWPWGGSSAVGRLSGGAGPHSPLAEDLAAAGWTLHTSPGCGHCKRQLKVLGDSYPGHMHVVCEGPSPPETCRTVAGEGVPHWSRPGDGEQLEEVVGFQSANDLSKMARAGPGRAN